MKGSQIAFGLWTGLGALAVMVGCVIATSDIPKPHAPGYGLVLGARLSHSE